MNVITIKPRATADVVFVAQGYDPSGQVSSLLNIRNKNQAEGRKRTLINFIEHSITDFENKGGEK